MKMTIGMAIRTVRSMRNWTVDEVAERTKYSRGYITMIENDERNPSLATLLGISEGLGIPLSYLTMLMDADHPVIAPLNAIIYTQLFEGAVQL